MNLHGIYEYFDFVGGASSHKTRERKSEVIDYVLESVGCTDRSSVVLIGDRVYDAVGANESGIDSIGVLWGHGSAEEIASSPFTYTAKNTDDVKRLLGI